MEQLLFQRQHKLMVSPVLAALLEAPTGLCGFGAGQVNGCPFCADFFSCLLLSLGCLVSVQSQQTEPYLFTPTGLQSETAAPDSSASTCLGLSPVIHGHPGREDRNWGFWSLTDHWECLQCREKPLCNPCEMVPTLKVWN